MLLKTTINTAGAVIKWLELEIKYWIFLGRKPAPD